MNFQRNFLGDSLYGGIGNDLSNNLLIINNNTNGEIIIKLGDNTINSNFRVVDNNDVILFQTSGNNSTICNTLTVSSDIHHLTVPVAYGIVGYSNGDTTISSNYPSTGISATDTGGSSRQITIPEMANTNYLVLLSLIGNNQPGTAPSVSNKTTTTFNISGPAEANNRDISFIVFGTLA